MKNWYKALMLEHQLGLAWQLCHHQAIKSLFEPLQRRPRLGEHVLITPVKLPQSTFGNRYVSACTMVADDATAAKWLAGAANTFCMSDQTHVRTKFELFRCESIYLDRCLALV
jgi:hypothetical protein